MEAEIARDKTKKNSRIKALWRNHPTAAERLKILREPHRLFRVAPDLPFITGILFSFVITGVPVFGIPFLFLVTSPLMFVSSHLTEMALLQKQYFLLNIAYLCLAFLFLLMCLLIAAAGFLLGYLIVRTLVLQLLRKSVEEAVRWQKSSSGVLRCLKLALITSIGYEIGFFISPIAVYAPRSLTGVAWVSLYFPIMVGFIWIVLLYARYFGTRLFLSHQGKKAPRWKLQLLLFVVNVLFSLPFLQQLLVRFLMQNEDPTTIKFLTLTLIFAFVGSCFLIALTFAASWFFAAGWRLVDSPRCFDCQTPISGDYKTKQFCGACGINLTPWLFAN